MNADLIVSILALVAMLVGVVGIVVPVLPGTITIVIAALVWAIVLGTGSAWIGFAVIVVLGAIGMAAGIVLTGRRLKEMGIPNSSLLIGGVGAVVGFFAIPVVGLLIGFVGGLYLAEYLRIRDPKEAWTSSWAAIKAAGLGMVVEFACAAIAVAVFCGVSIAHFV